jgi:hypothetical protein
MKAAALACLALTCLGVACSSTPAAPAAPSTTSTPAAPPFFTGTLPPMGSSFYSFSLTQAGTVSLTLASLTFGPQHPVPATVVGLGFGTPVGTDCGLTTSLKTAAGLVAQINTAASIGTFCVDIFDVGNLNSPVDFAIRIVHP